MASKTWLSRPLAALFAIALLGSVAISAPSRSASGRLPSLLGLAKALRRGLAATKAEKNKTD